MNRRNILFCWSADSDALARSVVIYMACMYWPLACGLVRMETSVRYLELAVKCDRLAKLAKTEEDRMILKEMAKDWRELTRDDRVVINDAQRRLIMRALTKAMADDRRSTNKGGALSRPTRDEYMQLIRLFGTLEPSAWE
jgi:hypothetical protein